MLTMQSEKSGATQTRCPGAIGVPPRMSGPQFETRVAAMFAPVMGCPVSFTSQKRFCAIAAGASANQTQRVSKQYRIRIPEQIINRVERSDRFRNIRPRNSSHAVFGLALGRSYGQPHEKVITGFSGADMAGHTDDIEGNIARLTAAVIELRAELLLTQATLASVIANVATHDAEPEVALGESVARLLGFADAAAMGLKAQPGVRPAAATDAATRIAEWAEGLLPKPAR